MNKCPYCESTRGFYYDKTIKHRIYKDYHGTVLNDVHQEIVYDHKTKYCTKCDEPITSYVKSLRIEK